MPAMLIRTVAALKREPVGTVIYNHTTLTEGEKTYFKKMAGAPMAEAVWAYCTPEGKVTAVGSEEFKDFFPAENISMPVWKVTERPVLKQYIVTVEREGTVSARYVASASNPYKALHEACKQARR